MKFNKFFLLLLILTAFPLIEAKKLKKVPKPKKGVTRLVPIEADIDEEEEKVTGFRPGTVDKEWRKIALSEEITHVENSIAMLEKQKDELKDKKGKEYTTLELRLLLKKDYLRGLKNILSVEKGERKMPKMMPSEGFEEEDEDLEEDENED